MAIAWLFPDDSHNRTAVTRLELRPCYIRSMAAAAEAIRTTVVPIRILNRTTVVPITPLIGTTVVGIRVLIGTTGIQEYEILF